MTGIFADNERIINRYQLNIEGSLLSACLCITAEEQENIGA